MSGRLTGYSPILMRWVALAFTLALALALVAGCDAEIRRRGGETVNPHALDATTLWFGDVWPLADAPAAEGTDAASGPLADSVTLALDGPPLAVGTFCENNGVLAMEAENYAAQSGYAQVADQGASGGVAIQVGGSGQVDYKIQLVSGGTWYFWAHTHATNSDDNGMFVLLDGQRIKALSGPYKGTDDIYLSKGGWSWVPQWQGSDGHAGPVTFSASAGAHMLSIAKRRIERPLIDKIVITIADGHPGGNGPPETPCAP